MDLLKQQLLDLLQPVFDRAAVFIVELELRGRQGSRVLNILADTEEGIHLNQITPLTREVSALLDVHDVIRGGYRLEISSPGIERPLQEVWQFQRHIGRDLAVVYTEAGEKQKIEGTLMAVDTNKIELNCKDGDRAIALEVVLDARVQLKW